MGLVFMLDLYKYRRTSPNTCSWLVSLVFILFSTNSSEHCLSALMTFWAKVPAILTKTIFMHGQDIFKLNSLAPNSIVSM